jgi:hypothetical protein
MVKVDSVAWATSAQQTSLGIGRDGMPITCIISSGILGTESAALDAAIRFQIPYEGYTNQGALLPGDRPAGRYRLDERPYVDPMLLMRANLQRADGLVIFSNGPCPERIGLLRDDAREGEIPCLHVDFASLTPQNAAFRMDVWVAAHNLSRLFITGPEIREDRRIYQCVHDTMSGFFMLLQDASMPLAQRTLH